MDVWVVKCNIFTWFTWLCFEHKVCHLTVTASLHVCTHAWSIYRRSFHLPISTADARRECNIFVRPTTPVPSYRSKRKERQRVVLDWRRVRYRERRAMETKEENEQIKAADGTRTAKAQTIWWVGKGEGGALKVWARTVDYCVSWLGRGKGTWSLSENGEDADYWVSWLHS